MYEGDTPSAERRAAALSLDTDLLRELLGQEELRELIDSARARPASRTTSASLGDDPRDRRDGLHDILRALGDLSGEELSERVFAGVDADALLATLQRERRAVPVRIAGSSGSSPPTRPGSTGNALGAVPPAAFPSPSSPTYLRPSPS